MYVKVYTTREFIPVKINIERKGNVYCNQAREYTGATGDLNRF